MSDVFARLVLALILMTLGFGAGWVWALHFAAKKLRLTVTNLIRAQELSRRLDYLRRAKNLGMDESQLSEVKRHFDSVSLDSVFISAPLPTEPCPECGYPGDFPGVKGFVCCKMPIPRRKPDALPEAPATDADLFSPGPDDDANRSR